jgi:hypothetical protein
MAVADLFSRDPTPPLAEAMRPKVLDEVIGQSDLLGDGKPLKLAFTVPAWVAAYSAGAKVAAIFPPNDSVNT